MAFEVFKKSMRPFRGEPRITVLHSGYLSLNRACLMKFSIKGDHAVLMFDREARRMGLRMVKAGTPEAVPLRASGKGGTATISAAAFLRHYDVPFAVSTSYIPEWDEAERILMVDLKKPPLPGRVRSKG